MSNMADIDFSSLEKLTEQILKMGEDGLKIQDEALLAGGEIFLDEMKRNHKYKDRSEDLTNSLELGKVKKEKGVKTVAVGVDKKDKFNTSKAIWMEYGTSKMSARPFMMTALENKQNEVKQKAISIITDALNL